MQRWFRTFRYVSASDILFAQDDNKNLIQRTAQITVRGPALS